MINEEELIGTKKNIHLAWSGCTGKVMGSFIVNVINKLKKNDSGYMLFNCEIIKLKFVRLRNGKEFKKSSDAPDELQKELELLIPSKIIIPSNVLAYCRTLYLNIEKYNKKNEVRVQSLIKMS